MPYFFLGCLVGLPLANQIGSMVRSVEAFLFPRPGVTTIAWAIPTSPIKLTKLTGCYSRWDCWTKTDVCDEQNCWKKKTKNIYTPFPLEDLSSLGVPRVRRSNGGTPGCCDHGCRSESQSCRAQEGWYLRKACLTQDKCSHTEGKGWGWGLVQLMFYILQIHVGQF